MATRKSTKKTAKKAAKGLDHRQRDKSGLIHKKRSDTHVATLRKEYGESFLKGYKEKTKLGAVLKKEGVDSLHQLLKKHR